MKTLLKLMALIAISSLFMTGCSNKEIDIDKHVKNQQMINELEGAPQWVMSHPEDDKNLYGLGVATKTAGDISFQRQIAMANARDEIARTINIKVKNMLKSYKEKTGTLDDSTFDKVVSTVSKQVSNQVLRGTSQYKDNWWISKSGNLYILVSMPKKNVKEEVLNATKTSFKNNNAMWQKFQAKQAQDELKAEINSNF